MKQESLKNFISIKALTLKIMNFGINTSTLPQICKKKRFMGLAKFIEKK
jgi:hypothetical protein